MIDQHKVAIKRMQDFLLTSKFNGYPEFRLYTGIIMLAVEDLYSLEPKKGYKAGATVYLRGPEFKKHLKILGLSYDLFRRKQMGFK